MRYKNFYEVNFVTKAGGYRRWKIHVEAFNADEAKEIARNMWYTRHLSHMFNIGSRRLKDTEEFLYHSFKEVVA